MLDFFSTLPGILVICGVVLLVIAVILLMADNKKKKKGNAPVNQTLPNTNNAPSTVTENVAVADSIPAVPPVAMTYSEPTNNMNIVDNNTSTNMNTIGNNTSINTMMNPNMATMNSMPSPVVEPEVPVENIVSIPEMEVTPSVVNIEESKPEIYGGVETTQSPISTPSTTPKPVTIYGGNDPLEATQSLPKIGEHYAPYSGEYKETKPVEPMNINIPSKTQQVNTASTPSIEESNSTSFIGNVATNNQPTTMPNSGYVINIPEKAPTEPKVEEL